MASVNFKIDVSDIVRIQRGMVGLKQIIAGGILGLMPAVGQLVTKQIKRRINSEKTSPDGERWRQNLRGNSILVLSGALVGGIRARSSLFRTVISAPKRLPYARIHQTGGIMRPRKAGAMRYDINGDTIVSKKSVIPQRMYMGLSPSNLAEIKVLVDSFGRRAFGWL